jgi:hypothetical protein
MKIKKEQQPLKITSIEINGNQETLILEHDRIAEVVFKHVGTEEDFLGFLKRIIVDSLNERKSFANSN